MLVETIDLWSDGGSVKLQTYILNNSPEFRTDERRPAILICPGGAYLYTSDREAEPIAMKFAALGYHTFVLRYNTYYSKRTNDPQQSQEINEQSKFPQPLYDVAKAMMTIRENAGRWHVDPDRIAVSGFSAGGHLAASLGVFWNDPILTDHFGKGNEQFWKPNALILGYPLLDYVAMMEAAENEADESKKELWLASNQAVFGTHRPDEEEMKRLSPAQHVSPDTPPVFMWHTVADDLVYVTNVLYMALALTKHKVPYEMHVFEEGVHGLAAADETSARDESQINQQAQVWIQLAAGWLKKHFAVAGRG